MTKYREILRLSSLGLSQQSIADSCNVSKKTVNRVLRRAKELDISWPLDESDTDAVLAEKFFPSVNQITSNKRMPDYAYIRKELLRNGVSKKLLWTEYMEDCRANGDEPLMYSQFCYHIQQDEQKRRATMHINRKPGEQVEVDWAGDPATIIDPDTVTGKPPVLQTKNKRKRGTSCENSSFFVFCISTRPASLLARLFHLGNPLFAFFRKLLRPWKQVLQEIQIRIIHVFRNLGQQMRNVVEDIQIVEFAGFHNAVDDGTGFGSVDGVD